MLIVYTVTPSNAPIAYPITILSTTKYVLKGVKSLTAKVVKIEIISFVKFANKDTLLFQDNARYSSVAVNLSLMVLDAHAQYKPISAIPSVLLVALIIVSTVLKIAALSA